MKQKNTSKHAPLITCEGIDGSGKSSVVKALQTFLAEQNIPVLLTKEPGASTIGKEIRSIVQHHTEQINPISEFLLFAADRADHVTSIVKPALEQGTWVISDRMHDSSVAYQGYGRGLDIQKIKAVNSWALQGIEPTLTIFLDLDPKIAFERIKERNKKTTRFEQEELPFWLKVTEGFKTLFTERNNVLWIDASQPLASVIDAIIQNPLLKKVIDDDRTNA